VIRKRLHFDCGLFALRYVWFLFLGWKVVLLGLLISGAVTCWVVTANHQGEEMFTSKDELKIKGV